MSDAGNSHAWLRPTLDYGPLAVFFVTYVASDLMAATGAIIFASLAALILAWTVERRVPLIPVVTTMLIVVFGGLTLWLQDETFIKMKPTIVQALFAAILLGGLVRGRSLLKPLLGAALPQMSDAAWRQLTLRYALFFVAMAVLNELVWRTQSTDLWVSFKVFGLTSLMVLFILSQIPFLGRQARKPVPAQAPARETSGG
jgi:intracellular septation protein